jgi:glucose/arabinose dehydrogenase
LRRALAAGAAGALLLAGCLGGGSNKETTGTGTTTVAEGQAPAKLARNRGGPRVETVARGLRVPWEIAFLPDGRALITERPGTVRLLSRDLKLRREPVARVEVHASGEGGLLGMAVDPDFDGNRFVYLYRTTSDGNQLVRYRLEGERLRQQRVIARDIQAGDVHDGGRVRFGPDGRLYFTTGEAGQGGLAQDPRSLNGKVLRMEPDAFRGGGGRPEVVSLGHRNPQGFDWQPGSGRLVEDEHGPVGNDEINFIRDGANYGWPIVDGSDQGGYEKPVALFPTSIAPSGATFVRLPGSTWTGDYLIACLVGQQIRRIRIRGGRVVANQELFGARFGRLRTVVEGPDGALYVLTNNRDGRGVPHPGDDRLLRIVPPSGRP